MKKLIGILFVISFASLIGCNEVPGCSDMTWSGDANADYFQPDVLYSAGENCQNYNDYYDQDINLLLTGIQNMKIVLDDTCHKDGVETDCPEDVVDVFEVGVLSNCQFTTPPQEGTDCAVGPINLIYKDNSVSENIIWECNSINETDAVADCAFRYFADDFKVFSQFYYENRDEKDTSIVYITYKWENGEELELTYKVQ